MALLILIVPPSPLGPVVKGSREVPKGSGTVGAVLPAARVMSGDESPSRAPSVSSFSPGIAS